MKAGRKIHSFGIEGHSGKSQEIPPLDHEAGGVNPVVFFANPTHAARLAQIHAEALPDDFLPRLGAQCSVLSARCSVNTASRCTVHSGRQTVDGV